MLQSEFLVQKSGCLVSHPQHTQVRNFLFVCLQVRLAARFSAHHTMDTHSHTRTHTHTHIKRGRRECDATFFFFFFLTHPWQLKKKYFRGPQETKNKTNTHKPRRFKTTQLETGASGYVQKRGSQNEAAPCPVGSSKCLPRCNAAVFKMEGDREGGGGVALEDVQTPSRQSYKVTRPKNKKHRREHLQMTGHVRERPSQRRKAERLE